MRRVSDDFLLNMAEVTGTLVSLFLVGVFFYVERAFGRRDRSLDVFAAYLRSGTRITLIVLSIPLGLSLSLVVLDPVWSRVLFVLLSVALIGANIDSAIRVRGVPRATGSVVLLVNEVVATVLTVILLLLPWVLGGLHPTRRDFTWSILIAFAAGLMSIGSIVMSTFDVARPRASAKDPRRDVAEEDGEA
ncbi:MAG TPA: hypothetical protein VGZ51_07200 [Actinomycetota bacterium]|nr:hypothetical protein [Actinomycetota bacterium]